MNHTKEDALEWALKIAAAGIEARDLLADASAVQVWLGGEITPVEQAVLKVQGFRGRAAEHAKRAEWDPWANGGLVDEFLTDLMRELSASSKVKDWADTAQVAEILAERDRARDTAVRLEQELAEKETELAAQNDDLVKGVLMAVRRHADHTLTEAGQIAIRRAVEHVARDCGVTL